MSGKIFEDHSENGIYSKYRVIGHILSISPIVSIVNHSINHSFNSITVDRLIYLLFAYFAWYIVTPMVLLIASPNYASNETMEKGFYFQQCLIYYIFTPILIFVFLWLAFTPWVTEGVYTLSEVAARNL